MNFKNNLEVWKVQDLEIPYMVYVKRRKKESGITGSGSISVQEKVFGVPDIDLQNLLLQFYISLASSSAIEITIKTNKHTKKPLWLSWDHQCKVSLLHDPCREGWFLGFHFVNVLGVTLKWAVIHSQLS